MSDATCERNLERYKLGHFADNDTPFCLAQVSEYEPGNQDTLRKKEELLEGRTSSSSPVAVRRECNMGGCALTIIQGEESGRSTVGKCMAASYCLKAAFEAVKQAPTVHEGKALYEKILDTLEFQAGGDSAGNFCPRLDCELSAGVSVDGYPGAAGQCLIESSEEKSQVPAEPLQ